MTLRKKIIETATKLFMNNGYSRTSTRDIAQILNVSQPAIYHHFKNKEMLYVAVLTEFANTIGKSLYEILENSDDDNKLFAMSEYLQTEHSLNLSLMMHDMELSLSDQSKIKVFEAWNYNYFKPFQLYFLSIKNELIDDVDIDSITQHYMRILSAYVSDNYKSSIMNDINLEEIIFIFLRGIQKHA